MEKFTFEPPVGIVFGTLEHTRAVTTLREAIECLLSNRWPDRSSDAYESALSVFIAVTNGVQEAARARSAFAEAAREAGILVDHKRMLH